MPKPRAKKTTENLVTVVATNLEARHERTNVDIAERGQVGWEQNTDNELSNMEIIGDFSKSHFGELMGTEAKFQFIKKWPKYR